MSHPGSADPEDPANRDCTKPADAGSPAESVVRVMAENIERL